MNDIDKLLQSAKENDSVEFPLSDTELRSILDKADATESNTNSKSVKNKGRIKMAATTSSILLGALGVALLLNPSANDNKKSENSKIKSSQVNTMVVKKTITKDDKRIDSNTAKQIEKEIIKGDPNLNQSSGSYIISKTEIPPNIKNGEEILLSSIRESLKTSGYMTDEMIDETINTIREEIKNIPDEEKRKVAMSIVAQVAKEPKMFVLGEKINSDSLVQAINNQYGISDPNSIKKEYIMTQSNIPEGLDNQKEKIVEMIRKNLENSDIAPSQIDSIVNSVISQMRSSKEENWQPNQKKIIMTTSRSDLNATSYRSISPEEFADTSKTGMPTPEDEFFAHLEEDLKNQELRKNKIESFDKDGNLYIDVRGDNPKHTDSLEILRLNDKELENIGVFNIGCGYAYVSESIYPPSNLGKNGTNMLKEAGYPNPEKGIMRNIETTTRVAKTDHQEEMMKYQGWNQEKTLGIFPINSSYRIKEKENSSSGSTSYGFTAIDENKTYLMCNQPFDMERIFFSKIKDNHGDITKYNRIKVLFDKDSLASLDWIIPIFVQNKPNSLEGCATVMTFPRTKAIIDRLPERYKMNDRDSIYSGLIKYDKNSIDVAYNLIKTEIQNKNSLCVEKPKEKVKENIFEKPRPIGGIEKISLTLDDLKALDVEFKDDAFIIKCEDLMETNIWDKKSKNELKEKYNYDLDASDRILLKSNIITKISPDKGESPIKDHIKYDGWDNNTYSHFAPIYYKNHVKVANYQFILTCMMASPYFYMYDQDKKINTFDLINNIDSNPILSKLIPVEVDWKNINKNGDSTSTNILLWYYADKEFANRLPEKYKNAVLKEIEVADKINKGNISLEDGCTILKGEPSYLGICSLSSGAVNNFMVYPNPSVDKNIQIKANLNKAEKLKVELYDEQGEFRAMLKDFDLYEPGEQKIALQLPSDISSGVYLVSLVDNKGQRSTNKIVLNFNR
jgi:hypothetical protein